MWAHGHQVVFFFPSFFEMEIFYFLNFETTKRPPSGFSLKDEKFFFFKIETTYGGFSIFLKTKCT
jgi:hypothetical protein